MMMSAPLNLSSLARRAALVLSLMALVIVTGCNSSGRSVSLYGAPSVSVATAKTKDAKRQLRKVKRDVRAGERRKAILEKAIARDTRRLKRKKISKSRRDRYTKRRARNEASLKTLNRSLRTLKRQERRAARTDRNATRTLARARRAAERTKRRVALAEKRKADDARIAAARRTGDATPRRRGLSLFGLRNYGTAERAAPAAKPVRTASLGGALFASRDPALANVKDYGARIDGGFQIDAIPLDKVNQRYYRQRVSYTSKYKPGTVVVDPHARFLYVVEAGGKAMRYGIGVGREGFEWSGEAHIGFKRAWPTWTPPEEMIARQPKLAKYCADCGGMPGGPANPLGARALYLVANGKDTLYRLHGTPQWNSIGTAASSGCIRLMNQDVIDLYNRVPTGSKVVVLS